MKIQNMKYFGICFLLLVFLQNQFVDGYDKNTSREDGVPVYRVSTVLNYPWIMHAQNGYEGFLVDLLDDIAEIANFTYIFGSRPNTEYGTIKNTVDGIQVNGMIEDLVSHKADLAVADLTISEMRSAVISFTSPFATTGAQILLRPPDHKPIRSLGLLLMPFSLPLWLCIILMLLVTTAVHYVIDRLSQPDGCPPNAIQSFHPTLCLFFLKDPPGLTTGITTVRRISSIICLTFSVLILASYIASLTGYLCTTSSTKAAIPFKTFEQMSRQADVQYGGWYEMPLNLNDNVQRLINRHISSKYTYYSNIEEAVKRVMDIDKPFAAIVEGYEGQKAVNRHCELLLLKEMLFEINYGLACRRDVEGLQLCSDISSAITNLKESGKLFAILEKWWRPSLACDKVSEDNFITATSAEIMHNHFSPIGIIDMVLAFILLLIGNLISIIATVVNHQWCKSCKNRKGNQNRKNSGSDLARATKDDTSENA